MDYLSKADAILFVLTAQKICSADEMSFIENNLKNQGFTDPFFIVNRFDQIDEDEREDMKFFVNQKLGSYSTNEPFFVSGLKALEGKMQNDPAKYAESGMAELEERLSEFLTKEKGRAKLLQPANELKKIVGTETLTEVIPMQRKLLSASLDEVKGRYEKEKPRLEDLKQRKAKVEMTLKLKIEQSKPIFKKALLASYESISSQVSAWVQEANPQTKLGILPNKEKFAAFGEEIVDFVNAKIEVQQAEWKKNVFEPLVTEKGTEIFTSLKEELKEFYQKVGEINVSLSGSDEGMNDASIEKKVSELLEGAGLSVSAEISDRYAKSIALEVGLGAVLTILGLLNPLTIGVMIGSVLFSRSKNERDIKNAVAAQIINSLTNESAAQSDAIADAVAAKLNELSSDIIKGLDAEINGMEDQVKMIIAELEKGQQAVDAKNKEIDVCEADAKLVCEKADALIEKIAQM